MKRCNFVIFFLLSFILAGFLMGCSAPQATQDDSIRGCSASEGYEWCELTQECILSNTTLCISNEFQDPEAIQRAQDMAVEFIRSDSRYSSVPVSPESITETVWADCNGCWNVYLRSSKANERSTESLDLFDFSVIIRGWEVKDALQSISSIRLISSSDCEISGGHVRTEEGMVACMNDEIQIGLIKDSAMEQYCCRKIPQRNMTEEPVEDERGRE